MTARAAVMPGALVLAALTVPAACGPARQPGQTRSSDASSARFRDVTNYVEEGVKRDEVLTGAFDWAKREGWSSSTYGGSSGSLLQVGDECFSHSAGEDWRHWHLQDRAGFCEDVFESPQKLLEGLRSYGSLEKVGDEDIRGVRTTHYRVVPNDDSDDPELWLEIWLDESEAVYRLWRPLGEASPRTREYFDFGVDVHVAPPCRVVPNTLPADTDKSTRCIEEEE